jgi:hypothetical protein
VKSLDSGENRKPSREHDPKPDFEPECLVHDLTAEAINCGAEIIPGYSSAMMNVT